ncbi:unnamed protein product [Caenorhabditis auriculariae]|uniref:Uncharacterized protein n=1 Tax=Caenorhabditis auriculariae TaxID=2777116 RepID=A0A8S1GR11_9PELO|nr:unnamed protein product [Caenorhabditis auriculariae]
MTNISKILYDSLIGSLQSPIYQVGATLLIWKVSQCDSEQQPLLRRLSAHKVPNSNESRSPLPSQKCADHQFIGCMLRLKAQRVPVEKNIMSLVFSIGTEARLLHTCKVYSSTLPCFQEKISECGDDKQRRLLAEVSKMIMFMCSPFSLQRQRSLIANQQCINSVLSIPATTGCALNEHENGLKVLQCKKKCSSRGSDFICMMRTWISEQNTCTLRDIQTKCGDQAANLYEEMQTTVFDPQFPVICNYDKESNITTETPATDNIVNNQLNSVYMKPPRVEVPDFEPVKPESRIQQNFPSEATTLTKNRITTTQTSTSAPMTAVFTSRMPIPQARPAAALPPVPVYNYRTPAIVLPSKRITEQESLTSPFIATDLPTKTFFTTQHPLFTTTVPGATPRTRKVIDILKSLLPANLPSKLTSLLENSLDRENFNPDLLNFNTPTVDFSSELCDSFAELKDHDGFDHSPV